MVNVLIKHLYEVSCWYKTTQFISHPFLMISRKIRNNQKRKYYKRNSFKRINSIFLSGTMSLLANPIQFIYKFDTKINREYGFLLKKLIFLLNPIV